MSLTITEALAEIKTIDKRIEKKREYITQYIARQEGAKDPLEKDGGSVEVIRRETQAINDLYNRLINLRTGIQRTNNATEVTIGTNTMTISEWLVWRREIAPPTRTYLHKLRQSFHTLRDQTRRQGVQLVSPGNTGEKPTDVIVNIDEATLAKEIEAMEETLGALDGQLSLKNATVQIVE